MDLQTYITRVLDAIHPQYTSTVEFEAHLDTKANVVESSPNIIRFTIALNQKKKLDIESMKRFDT